MAIVRLDKEAFAACEGDSIDYAVMEKTRCAAVVPVARGGAMSVRGMRCGR
jgi:mannose-1-phosphate guanylyltransferase/mannose-6-phosphate isomerase